MYIHHIDLGGENRPMKFGFNALSEYGELAGKTVDEVLSMDPNKMSVRNLLQLCWCALKHGARVEKKEFIATLEDVADWLDDNPEALIQISQEYARSRGAGLEQQGGEKKKATKHHP